MKSTLYLPQKIKVGYQKRSDTYTGQLAYVIYYDSKGKLRKEASWENWRNKEIEPNEFENNPIEGFVLNKKVGDYVCDWNHRKAYTRVYDPRGFEFEITVENLLYILENTSSIKGKGLEGEFVYVWDGTELILMPTCSPDFKSIMEYNKVLQSNKKFNSKNLIIGATYRTKNNGEVVYIGRYPVYDDVYEFDGKEFTSYRKLCNYCQKEEKEYRKYVPSSGRYYYGHYEPLYKEKKGVVGKEFWFGYKSKKYWYDDDGWNVEHKSSASDIIDVIDENCHPEYAEIFDEMERNPYYSPYDQNKDEYIEYSFEEFEKEFLRNSKYQTILINFEGNKCKCSFEISDIDGKKFIKPKRYQSYTNVEYLYDIFDCYYDKSTHSYYFHPIGTEEFVKKYHPFYKNLYLQNGKFWKKETWKL